MNILMLTNTYLPHVGGVAGSVAAFTAEYRRQGHRVLVVAPEFEGRPEQEEDVIRVPALQKFNGSDFSVRVPIPGILTAALAEFQPQIVHSHHSFLLGDTAVRVAADYNLPLVFTHHTMYEQYTHYVPGDARLLGSFVTELTTGYTHLCDAVIAPSDSVAAVLRERGVVVPIEVIPTGVDVPRFAKGDGAALRRELGIPPEAFVVGHLGRLAPEKNLPFLARAVAAFLKRNRAAHFLVVGFGPEEAALRELFRAPRLRDRLHMPGVCRDQRLVDAYHAMDVFAFASHSETQGMVLTEAMAAGVPVVAIDAPGAREVVQDGVNGRLLPSQHQRSFVAALDWVARRAPRQRAELAQAARARADEFSMPRTAERALRLYGSLIAGAASDKHEDESAWENAMRRVEAEWELWANLAAAASATMDTPRMFRVPVIGTALHGWQIVRRWFSRSEWGARLLGLPKSQARAQQGLILLQIDGLSRPQFEKALRRRRMPFLRRLLARDGYEVHTHYSGLPSTTAAVLGELFYGVRGAVPAFAFGLREEGRVVNMLDPNVAADVQRRISQGRIGLLEGGSAACDPYSGGAAEPHFCAASIGWNDVLRYANPWGALIFGVTNLMSLVRALGLAAFEFLLAIIDCVRGAFAAHDLWREIKFIPSRVIVCSLLRDLMTIAAEVNAARGLPVIQLNYLAYDEQSHRRGPDSAFAHWSLRGIDAAIARVCRAARNSTQREYTIWIYSDHGQARVAQYERLTGRTIEEAVRAVIADARVSVEQARRDRIEGVASQRAAYLGRRWSRRYAPLSPPADPNESNPKKSNPNAADPSSAHAGKLLVAATGPVGHIYLPNPAERDELAAYCQRLVRDAQVPLAMAPIPDSDDAWAWTAEGQFELPRDAASILGHDHPFLEQAAADLARLCHHDRAGDIVIIGWRQGTDPISFVPENGAHGGPHPNETTGFALLPRDTRLPEPHADHLRPAQLRQAALAVLGRGAAGPRRSRGRSPRSLRIATYNVHSCVGLDGRLSIARIARVLAHLDADVVALQELDMRRSRSGHADQAREIARELEMEFHFHPALRVAEEAYGDAVLSRFPMRLVRTGRLPAGDPPPGKKPRFALEPRGALWVAIDVDGQEVQLVNTHLGLLPREQAAQVETLLGPDWLGHADCQGPVVLCGDFNLPPRSPLYRRITGQLRDAQHALNGHRPRNTWFSHLPFRRIDYVFVNQASQVIEVQVPNHHLAKAASDHLPIVVDLRLP
jgi:endonuclease/exonuclease/phosphatase family metal-dependent hydrolase/glycosyltransferase involved in cell wall biosynthesis